MVRILSYGDSKIDCGCSGCSEKCCLTRRKTILVGLEATSSVASMPKS